MTEAPMPNRRAADHIAASNKPVVESVWRRVWARPDPHLADVGFTGEYLVAGMRLLIAVLLIYVPLGLQRHALLRENLTPILVFIAGALLEALLVYSAVQRHWGRSWIGFASSLVDVSLVSGALAILMLLGQPLAATNSTLIYPFYFLAIGATSLRYDARICLLTGFLAIAQYGAVVYYALTRWNLAAPELTRDFGHFNTADQIGRLVLLLAATGLAVTLVVRAREASVLSMRDRLTGLLNRGVFDVRLEEEADRAARSGGPVAVAMIDVDHFKTFNDTYGHAGGDQALRALAQLLARSFRASDIVTRYGGEEFAVILPGMGADRITERLEAFRRSVEAVRLDVRSAAGKVGFTVSVGAAVWPEDGTDIHAAVAIADARLYRAKQLGRNLVVFRGHDRAPAAPEDPTALA
ncbi:MAG: GGDEF domain-containing protein [Acidobacteria bacterium]|nr:GGDEF domain-containing protein [Acidobacteriota bacterium]